MKVTDISYKEWMILHCYKCGEKFYSFEKINKTRLCSCGNKEIEILDVNEWNAVDHLFVCREELKKNALDKHIFLVDGIYDKLKKIVTNEELFNRVMKAVTDEMYGLIE